MGREASLAAVRFDALPSAWMDRSATEQRVLHKRPQGLSLEGAGAQVG